MGGLGTRSELTALMSGTLLTWTRKPLLQVTLADLQQFADSLSELAPASRYRTLSAIKSLLAFAHRTGYLPYDVGRALRLPAVRSRLAERILPEAELHRILSLETNPRSPGRRPRSPTDPASRGHTARSRACRRRRGA